MLKKNQEEQYNLKATGGNQDEIICLSYEWKTVYEQ